MAGLGTFLNSILASGKPAFSGTALQPLVNGLVPGTATVSAPAAFSGTALQSPLNTLLPGTASTSGLPAQPIKSLLTSLLGAATTGTATPTTGSSSPQTVNALVNTFNATALVNASTTQSTTTLGVMAYTPGSALSAAGNTLGVTASLGSDIKLGISDNTASSGTSGANVVSIPVDLLSGQASGASKLLSSAATNLLGTALPVVNTLLAGSSGLIPQSYTFGGGAGALSVGSGTNVVVQALTNPDLLANLGLGH